MDCGRSRLSLHGVAVLSLAGSMRFLFHTAAIVSQLAHNVKSLMHCRAAEPVRCLLCLWIALSEGLNMLPRRRRRHRARVSPQHLRV
mgnify:CR=1 FL=1